MSSQDDIPMKSQAMKMKLLRFSMKDIALTGYYSDKIASISLLDATGHKWYPNSSFNGVIAFVADSPEKQKWLAKVEKRKTTTDLHERYRAVLSEDIDFAMMFDCFSMNAKECGIIRLSTLNNINVQPSMFECFFMPDDTPESLMIQYDLYAKPISND